MSKQVVLVCDICGEPFSLGEMRGVLSSRTDLLVGEEDLEEVLIKAPEGDFWHAHFACIEQRRDDHLEI